MTVATFDYAAWAARYPEFGATVTDPQATSLFSEAGLFLDNTDGSVVQDITLRTVLLWMVTAHLAQLHFGSSIMANGPLVGRIDTAAEGTVNIKVVYPDQSGQAAWFSQTKYGAEFWAATVRYRAFRYRAPPVRRRFF